MRDTHPDPSVCAVDPFRRFEVREPDLADQVLDVVQLQLLDVARGLLDIARVEVRASPFVHIDASLIAVGRLLEEVAAYGGSVVDSAAMPALWK